MLNKIACTQAYCTYCVHGDNCGCMQSLEIFIVIATYMLFCRCVEYSGFSETEGNSCALPYCLDQTMRLLLILSEILRGFYLREAFIRGCCLFFYRCIEWHCTHTFTFPGTSDCKPKSGERLLNSSSQCIT